MDKLIDLWIDWQINGQIGRLMDRLKDLWINQQIYGKVNRLIGRLMVRLKDLQID